MRRPQTPRPLPINKDGSNGAARGAAKSAQPRQSADANTGPAKTGSAAGSRQRESAQQRVSSRQSETRQRDERQKLLAGVKIGAKIQRVRALLLDVVQCAVRQLKLLVKPSPALALG